MARLSISLAFVLLALTGCARKSAQVSLSATPPAFVLGAFEDDYDGQHTITQTEWFHHPRSRYRIVKWNVPAQYLIAHNDDANPGDAGLWTRIDWMLLPDMAPYTWAYCLSAFDAATADVAEATAIARREEPRTGCNGFPFSRMRPATEKD